MEDETIVVVLTSLLAIRQICEVHGVFFTEWLQNPQGQALVNATVAACCNTELWIWMRKWFDLIIEPMEMARRWGLVCSCCLIDDGSGRTRKGAKRDRSSR